MIEDEKKSVEFSIISSLQNLLSIDKDAIVTPSMIDEKFDLIVQMDPRWRIADKEIVIGELIRRFSIRHEKDLQFSDQGNHEPWLTSTRKNGRRYWDRYRQKLSRTLPESAINALDVSTDEILSQLEDPSREGFWDRRGMVVGHVQSGKTGNYTGLICKAADAGYKIIIVLAGMHNNLRSQTQIRLDSDFVGMETSIKFDDNLKPIGVGLIDRDKDLRPHYATDRSNSGDFNQRSMRLGITPEKKPLLLVVKKQRNVLTQLHNWLKNHLADDNSDSESVSISRFPLLMIDDEADQASVDTGDGAFISQNDPNLVYDPKTINKLIRQLLKLSDRSAFVGYTATPFANVFIHERATTNELGPDLFPSAFIRVLGVPSNYIGPSQVFGVPDVDGRSSALPLTYLVNDCFESDDVGWIPPKHKSSHVPVFESENSLPDSLTRAIQFFILACAIRDARGERGEHVSMLVHVTRYVLVQNSVKEAIDDYLIDLRRRGRYALEFEEISKSLKTLYEEDFVSTRKVIIDHSEYGRHCGEFVTWDALEPYLKTAMEEISVKEINGSAKDCLDFNDAPSGLKVIAIGGDKLSRGLTLEGLCVSYFLRASKMYDTLTQMGRWFGYREGYLDLCRLYLPSDLKFWMEKITDASTELREDIVRMYEDGDSPREFGLKVRSHNSLLITSRVKMRNAQRLQLTYSGSVSETIAFLPSDIDKDRNYRAFKLLLKEMGDVNPVPHSRVRNDSSFAYWSMVPAEKILAFLAGYRSHPDSIKANSMLLSKFIEAMNTNGELLSWNVLVKNGSGEVVDVSTEHSFRTAVRTPQELTDKKYSISRLLGSVDESEDMSDVDYKNAFKLTEEKYAADKARDPALNRKAPTQPSGAILRHYKYGLNKARGSIGTMIFYLPGPVYREVEATNGSPYVGFGMSFPTSSSGTCIEYQVNNVYWEQEIVA